MICFLYLRQLKILFCITFTSSCRLHLLGCSSKGSMKASSGHDVMCLKLDQNLQLAPSAEYLRLQEA